MFTFKEYLLEYLTDEQRSRYAGVKMTPKARKDTDHFFGKGNDHVKEPIKGYVADKSEVHKQIEHHVGKEISSDDYKSGTTTDKHGRTVKLGKMIHDDKLRNQFANDSVRQGTKSSKDHYATVVRGTEVAGQTNSAPDKCHPSGHSWGEQSCKNVDTGFNRHFLEPEIKRGSVLVRVHDHDDKEIYRATLHPHHNDKKHTAYKVESEYGVKHPSFTAHAHDVAKRLSGEHKDGSIVYKKHEDVYDDSQSNTMLHPNATKEHLDKALTDKDADVRAAAASHPNVTKEHLDKALTDKDRSVRIAAAKHPKASKEHLDKALNDKDVWVRETAAFNPKASKEHLDKALNDPERSVRLNALKNHNVTGAHIDRALNDPDVHTRLAAVNHPNATIEHLDKALNNKYPEVRSAAAKRL